MLDQLRDDKWPITLRGMAIWGTAIWLVVMFFVPSDYVYKNMLTEIRWGESMVGSSDFQNVMSVVNQRYKFFFIDTHIDSGLKNFYSPIQADTKGGEVLDRIGNLAAPFFMNGAKVINYLFYIMVYRITLILFWIPFLIVVALPSLVAGFMRWQAKRYNFGYSSPFFNRRSLMVISWAIFTMIISIFVPFPVPPMCGAVIMIVAIPISLILLLSNLPKRL